MFINGDSRIIEIDDRLVFNQKSKNFQSNINFRKATVNEFL